MALLDEVLKRAAGATPTADGPQASLASAAISILLKNESGSISGLAQRFAAQGLGPVVSSWIGTGQNLPISSQQLQSVLGSEQVQAVAAEAGVSPDAAATGLAQILPRLIDSLTPNGDVPQGDLAAQGMELLKGRLFS